MIATRKIELLVPARNLECGIEAIKHGADAIYIGAPKFSARAAVGNSIADIEKLVLLAHGYDVRVYVALNTILKDEELIEVKNIIDALYRIRVDGLVIQDMGLLRLSLPPIPLHASTQMDNGTVEKINFLSKTGFHRVVLARELSLVQIEKIHKSCSEVILEAFVHGSLCVSYSGQCYASEACFGRSANRGECAQFCRLAFNMVDADGKEIACRKHLLSLKDMNRSQYLEQMMDAGVTSFKIEGRLKDVSYVKNVTAYYRQQIDIILNKRQEYVRASSGESQYTFMPQVDKSFNRGFIDYFLNGRKKDISSPNTPKSLGEKVGELKEWHGRFFTVSGIKPLHNGDGICFFDEEGILQGLRVNKVDTNKVYPFKSDMFRVEPHTVIYRNYDQKFEQELLNPSAERKIKVKILFYEIPNGFACSMTDENNNNVVIPMFIKKEKAHIPQQENMKNQLVKMGGTSFVVTHIEFDLKDEWFIPMSMISKLRHQLTEKLMSLRYINYKQNLIKQKQTSHPFIQKKLTYLGNVMNEQAFCFYKAHGVEQIEPAYEKEKLETATIMFCKHCLKYEMGWCSTYQSGKSPYEEPYYLVLPNSRRFRLNFDCRHCKMEIVVV